MGPGLDPSEAEAIVSLASISDHFDDNEASSYKTQNLKLPSLSGFEPFLFDGTGRILRLVLASAF